MNASDILADAEARRRDARAMVSDRVRAADPAVPPAPEGDGWSAWYDAHARCGRAPHGGRCYLVREPGSRFCATHKPTARDPFRSSLVDAGRVEARAAELRGLTYQELAARCLSSGQPPLATAVEESVQRLMDAMPPGAVREDVARAADAFAREFHEVAANLALHEIAQAQTIEMCEAALGDDDGDEVAAC